MTNSAPESAQLTDRLFAARQRPGRIVDLGAYRLSRFEALALQLEVADRYAEQGDPVGGWKVAYTSGGQRDRMGPGYRAFGFIPSSRVLDSGAVVALDAFSRASIEIEICLRVDADGRATAAAPAFELIDRRIPAGADDATVIADGCANWGIVVGSFQPLPATPLVELEARLLRDGRPVASCRPGAGMDDPLLSFARLQVRLGKYGRAPMPGQCVITGSITKQEVDAAGTWVGDIEQLGAVELTFA